MTSLLGGGGGQATDLTGLSPEQIASITALDIEGQKERSRVADLIRMATAGDVQTQLRGRELAATEERNRILDDYYSGQSTAAQTAAQINGLKLQLQALKDKAQINKDVVATEKLEKEIRDLDLKHNVLRVALESGITDPSQLNVGAQSILNRKPEKPIDTTAQERLASNDQDRLNISIEKAKDNENLAKSLIDSFNERFPDSNYLWYYHKGGIFTDNKAKRVDLPSGITAGDVVKSAEKHGMSIQEALKKKGWIK